MCVTRVSGGWLLRGGHAGRCTVPQLWSEAKVRRENRRKTSETAMVSYLELVAGLTAVLGQPACQTY